MRIDKYLWCTRYFKTRNQATQACKKGAARVNAELVKPAREIYPGDKITLRKDQVNYSMEVLDLPPSRVGAKLVGMYVKDITPGEELAHREMMKLSKEHYRKKGLGRPTKKDRRDLDDFTSEE